MRKESIYKLLTLLALMVASLLSLGSYYQFTTALVAAAVMLYILLIELERIYRSRGRPVKWPITFIYSRNKIKGQIMSFQLHSDEVLPFKLGRPVNSNGGEAPVEEGSLAITSSDPNVFAVERDPEFPDDPYAGLIVPPDGSTGTATFKAKADADLGEGVEEITLEIEGEVLTPGAVGFAPISFGTPRKKTLPG